jgi:hypothetical protein
MGFHVNSRSFLLLSAIAFGTVAFGISFRFSNESVNKNQNLPHVIQEKINKVQLGFFL